MGRLCGTASNRSALAGSTRGQHPGTESGSPSPKREQAKTETPGPFPRIKANWQRQELNQPAQSRSHNFAALGSHRRGFLLLQCGELMEIIASWRAKPGV